jgi:hypothetical protein
MEDWVLVVIVIVVVYVFTNDLHKKMMVKACGTHVQPVVQNNTPVVQTSGTTADNKETLENALIGEGIISSGGEVCNVGASVPTPYADNEYGSAGAQFVDWSMQATLDPKIIESNKQFVKERLGNPGSWTGAAFSPDRHDTYDAVPWCGLSRPSAVDVNSPDQIPDIDMNRNPDQKKFRWDSAVYS